LAESFEDFNPKARETYLRGKRLEKALNEEDPGWQSRGQAPGL
jgi:hypothetical protein